MCDYSLMMVPNRLAMEGEELVAHRFRSGTTGFVSCSDFAICRAERQPRNLWCRLKAWVFFSGRSHTSRVHSTGGGSSSREFPAPSVEDRTPVHPSWQLSLNCRPKQTNIGTRCVLMTGPSCGWQCLRKGNESRCCGCRPPRSVRSLPKRYSTATLRDDQRTGWFRPETSPPPCSGGRPKYPRRSC